MIIADFPTFPDPQTDNFISFFIFFFFLYICVDKIYSNLKNFLFRLKKEEKLINSKIWNTQKLGTWEGEVSYETPTKEIKNEVLKEKGKRCILSELQVRHLYDSTLRLILPKTEIIILGNS